MEMTKEEKAQDYKLKRRYGIDLARYREMLEDQGNRCAICGKPADKEKKALAVDHNHKTGYIRGLLCTHCNTNILKYLRDDMKIACGLRAYLQRAITLDLGWKQ